jgi:hypothetical protein
MAKWSGKDGPVPKDDPMFKRWNKPSRHCATPCLEQNANALRRVSHGYRTRPARPNFGRQGFRVYLPKANWSFTSLDDQLVCQVLHEGLSVP